MTYGYDKPLHAPARYKPMESAPRELNEEALDASIAEILNQEKPAPVVKQQPVRTEFPLLKPQESIASESEPRLAAALRQRWAQLSGAA